MPKFLNERQIGMDPAKVGFPNRGAEWDNNNPIRKISPSLGRGDTRDAYLAKATKGNRGELHAVKTLIEFTVT
jgi:hypothetical protein